MATFLDRNVDTFSTNGTLVEMSITEGPMKLSGAPRTFAQLAGTFRIGGTGATFARYMPGMPSSIPFIEQNAISGIATAVSTAPGSVGSVSIDSNYRETLTLTNLLPAAQVVTLTITDNYTYRVTSTAPPGISQASVLEMIRASAPGAIPAFGSYMASSYDGVAGPLPTNPLVVTLRGIRIPAMGHVDVSLTTDEFGRAYAAANPEPSSLVLACIGVPLRRGGVEVEEPRATREIGQGRPLAHLWKAFQISLRHEDVGGQSQAVAHTDRGGGSEGKRWIGGRPRGLAQAQRHFAGSGTRGVKALLYNP